jgi:hypothetical protein
MIKQRDLHVFLILPTFKLLGDLELPVLSSRRSARAEEQALANRGWPNGFASYWEWQPTSLPAPFFG